MGNNLIQQQKVIGRRIRFFRERFGISQLELQIQINSSSGFISRIECGQVNPSKETISKIAQILKLTNLELDYIDGVTSKPATHEEISDAVKDIQPLFRNNKIFGYLLDERARFLDISDGLLQLLNINPELKIQYFKKNFVIMILDPHSIIKNVIDENSFDDVVYNILLRVYYENSFMFDDEEYVEMINYVNKFPKYKDMWEKIKSLPKKGIHNFNYRKVNFKTPFGTKEMVYSVELLQSNTRFQIIEYITK